MKTIRIKKGFDLNITGKPSKEVETVLAGELEEALAHGLLDCVACGLCTYVCPSKIEIGDILKKAQAEYYHEIYS
jgi:Na+-transporting NADH:ubiquinone oxidoreductase subunit A